MNEMFLKPLGKDDILVRDVFSHDAKIEFAEAGEYPAGTLLKSKINAGKIVFEPVKDADFAANVPSAAAGVLANRVVTKDASQTVTELVILAGTIKKPTGLPSAGAAAGNAREWLLRSGIVVQYETF